MDSSSPGLRITVRVRPGAARAAVGGRYGQRALKVAVSARPVDGHALEQALDSRTPAPGLIHHSDRGVQYASAA